MAGEHKEQAAALLALGFDGTTPAEPRDLDFPTRQHMARVLGIEEAKVHALLHIAEQLELMNDLWMNDRS